jgi:hypothetical protein
VRCGVGTRRRQGLAPDLLDAAVAAPRPDGVALGPLERGFDRMVVGVADLAGRARFSESEEDGHGLRSPKGQVEAGHLVGLAKPCPR